MLKITLITLGNKMPTWVVEGSKEYSKRFNDGIQLKIIELPLARRTKTCDLSRVLEKETALIKDAIPNNARLIALDVLGIAFNSEELAQKIIQFQQHSSQICFLIGGPEGLSSEILQLCQEKWSLSKLTLPHPLARIMLLETLYRSWSMINNHPYHKY